MLKNRFGALLREKIAEEKILPFIGVYDVLSASIAARHYDALFVSGFSFAASFYGLPDIGFISWSDIVAFVQRLRIVLPRHHLLVDIDDGYGDPEVACHVVSLLEAAGASGVVLEDQRRPRRCGHFDGKQLLELEEFLPKLERVLESRGDLFVVARTDATEPEDIFRRVEAFSRAGADAVLVDAVRDPGLLEAVRSRVTSHLSFNQMAGGKSPRASLTQLRGAGVSLVIYSTPCLFAAQGAVEKAMIALKEKDGLLPEPGGDVPDLKSSSALLNQNLAGRNGLGTAEAPVGAGSGEVARPRLRR